MFTFLGTKFSSRYFYTAVVSKNYLKKVEREIDYQIPAGMKVRDNFEKIKFSTWQTMIEPLYACLFKKCCKNIRMRKKLIEEGNDKFSDELDVTNILKKIRKSDDMWNQLLTKK